MGGFLKKTFWAKINKTNTLLAVVGGTIVLFFFVYDRFKGPQVVGEFLNERYEIAPQLDRYFNDRVDLPSLSNQIAKAISAGQPPSVIISNIQTGQFRDHKLGNTRLFFMATCGRRLTVSLRNNGRETAHNVVLKLPGKGLAEVEEVDSKRTPITADLVTWTNGVPLGDMVPGQSLHILVWPEGLLETIIDNRYDKVIAVYTEGYSHLRKGHWVVGPLPDVMAATGMLQNSRWVYVLAAIIVIVISLVFFLRRRKPSQGTRKTSARAIGKPPVPDAQQS